MGEPIETVYTVHDWYDGPRSGAADYQGTPYWYRSIYLDNAEYNRDEDRFELTPLVRDALEWDLERDSIFSRWDAARKSGVLMWKDGDEEGFGALPEEMGRYRDLNRKIKDYLAANAPTLLVRGEFEPGCKKVRWVKEIS
jgi:hypothetical protein